MLQIKTLITALTVICIASVCLAGLITFMLWREAGRVLDQMHVREKLRSNGQIARLSATEATVSSALFMQSSRAEAMAAQQLVTQAFNAAEVGQPYSLETQIKRRMASQQIRSEFSEAELVHRYLETTYLGEGEYGLAAASGSMFGKRPEDLTKDEALTLAAVIRQPSLRSDPEKLALRVAKDKERNE